MVSNWRRLLLAFVVLVASISSTGALLLAATDGADREPASDEPPRLIAFEEQETFEPGVPADPYIDFCPTAEQVREFSERNAGQSLKPQPVDDMTCGRDGAWTAPQPPYPPPPGEEEVCEANRERLLESEPVHSHDPRVLRAEAPDGGEIIVEIEADPKFLEERGIRDLHDFARLGGC